MVFWVHLLNSALGIETNKNKASATSQLMTFSFVFFIFVEPSQFAFHLIVLCEITKFHSEQTLPYDLNFDDSKEIGQRYPCLLPHFHQANPELEWNSERSYQHLPRVKPSIY